MFATINPTLKSFFRDKKTVVEVGIEALLVLIFLMTNLVNLALWLTYLSTYVNGKI